MHVLGRSGVSVSKLGLGSSFGLETRDVERAHERGVSYLYWGSVRRPAFGRAIGNLAKKDRGSVTVAIQSYTRVAWMMRPSIEVALRRLGIEYADVLVLGWWNNPPPARILDAALELKERGKVRAIMVSCHARKTFAHYIADPAYDAIMVRYNAAHPGAEREVFPYLDAASSKPGVVAYTATRWGDLVNPKLTPPGERTPRASDCYRFAMTNPHVDVTLSGPKDARELDEALVALDRGPMSDDEIAWMKRVGVAVREIASARSMSGPVHIADRLMGVGKG